MTAAIGATGVGQRRYSASPETGTLTTSQPSAWATATAYVCDPTNGAGVNRVINGGRLYQCRVDHTSSGADEPTTTSDTTQWLYLGAAPVGGNTTAGSLVLAIHAGRNDPMSTPTDNDGGTFSSIGTFSYNDFAQWGMGLFRRTAAVGAKVGYNVSATWAGTSVGSGAGEEVTLLYLEVADVAVGAPSFHSHVERASPSGGKVAGVEYTIAVPTFVLTVWGGSGAVVTTGTEHVAAPLNGLAMIPGIRALMAISGDGYIQAAGAYAIRQPGTYTEEWTSGEGAQVFTAGWPVSVSAAGVFTMGDLTGSGSGNVLVSAAGSGTLGGFAGAGAVSVLPLTSGGSRIGAHLGARIGARIG